MHGARRWPTPRGEVRRLCAPPVRPRPPPIERCAGGLPAGRLIDPPRAPHAANRRSRARPPSEDVGRGRLCLLVWLARRRRRGPSRRPRTFACQLAAREPRRVQSTPFHSVRVHLVCMCSTGIPCGGGGGVRLGVAAGRQWRRRGRQPRWPAGPRGGSCRVGVCKTRCELAARTSRATSPVAPLACRCPGAGRLDCIPIFLASAYGARVECGGPRVVDRRRCGWRSVKYKYLPNIS